jgi:hypothetical protein
LSGFFRVPTGQSNSSIEVIVMKIMKIANMADERNMTIEQRQFPKDVQREAYDRIPETCKRVRSILEEAQASVMNDLEVEPHDIAIVDAIMSEAFIKIRDEVTQSFRTEQMRLINEMRK